MITKLEYSKNSVTFSGTLENLYGGPNPACMILIRSIPEGIELGRTTTDANGNFSMTFARSLLRVGVYRVEFYGSGYVIGADGTQPDWETVSYYDNSVAAVISLQPLDGLVFKYMGGIYTPTSIRVQCNTENITNPTYTWYVGSSGTPAQGPNDVNIYTVIPGVVYSDGSDSAVITCVVNGTLPDSTPLNSVSDTISITKLTNGVPGPGVPFRGAYDPTSMYYATSVRSDIVTYSGTYYICTQTTANPAGAWPGVGAYWTSFGEVYSSVATDIALIGDATITRALVLGTNQDNEHVGIVRTVDAIDVDDGNGIFISGTLETDARKGLFRVGSFDPYTNVFNSGIMWDGANLTIQSSNFALTSSGSMWATAGGFGGSVSSPYVNINNTGLSVQTTSFFTGDSTFWDLSFDTLIAGQAGENIRGYNITVPNSNFSAQTNWTTPTNNGGSTTGYFTFNASQCYELYSVGIGNSTILQSSVVTTGVSNVTLGTYNLAITFRTDFDVAFLNVGGVRVYSCNADGSSPVLVIDKQFVASYVANFMTINLQFDATTAYLLLDFYITCDATTANALVNMRMDLSNVSLTRWIPFVEISEKGIYIFKSPSALIKAGVDTFQVKGGTFEVENLIINGTLTLTGSTNLLSPSTYSINSDSIVEGSNLFFTTVRARGVLSGDAPVVYFPDYGTIGLNYSTNNFKLTSSALNTIQDIMTTSNVTFGTVTATTFKNASGVAVGLTVTPLSYTVLTDLPATSSLALPNGNTYIVGSNKLLVFVDGRLQMQGSSEDYLEKTTSTIQFNYDLAVGAKVLFLILNWG